MGANGIIQRYLGRYDIDFRDVKANIKNDSTLTGHVYAQSLSVGNNAIDTLSLDIAQQDSLIGFSGHMGNRKGTWDEMAQVDVNGYTKGA